MPEMPHTPGRWKVESEPNNVWDEEGLLVARVYSREGDERRRARLIAAAPEMLAMLEEVEWEEDSYCYFCCPVCDEAIPPRGEKVHAPDCRLAALLKKARGD